MRLKFVYLGRVIVMQNEKCPLPVYDIHTDIPVHIMVVRGAECRLMLSRNICMYIRMHAHMVDSLVSTYYIFLD